MHRQAQRFVSNGRTQTGEARVALITMPPVRAKLGQHFAAQREAFFRTGVGGELWELEVVSPTRHGQRRGNLVPTATTRRTG